MDEQKEVSKKLEGIIGEIEKLSVLELADLVKALEEKFGVSASAPVMVQAAPAAAEDSAGAEEKSAFTVKLTEVGAQKIEVIKVVRDVTGKGLKEAKDVVDAAAAGPQVVAENLKKEDAEALKKKFETAGAKVELQ
ncbi:MAG: 50S ribosomal protein L7/L12 [Parcubacteria group bacterium]|nr:50S ribosomal protein L7/L12 [Parcubacteria group bacterium]